MKRSAIFFGLSVLAICLCTTAVVQATPITAGSANSSDASHATLAGGSPTGNINANTMFTFGNLQIGPGGSGVFAGQPAQQFGVVAFDSTMNNSLDFSNPGFGSFASNTIMPVGNIPGFVNLRVTGVWNPGSDFSGLPAGVLTNFTITLTQTTPTSEIGFGGSFSSTNTIIPEPASMALLGSGLVGLAATIRRRMIAKK